MRDLPAHPDRDRPSSHGKSLGKALSAMAEAGRKALGAPDTTCVTCAFRDGCMTNQMAGTALTAFKCAIGADPDRFACHHGMQPGGQPTKLCAGYIAARAAPWDEVKAITAEVADFFRTPAAEPDLVRAAFDAWIARVDPNNELNDYERGRLYVRDGASMRPPVIEGESSRDSQKTNSQPKGTKTDGR